MTYARRYVSGQARLQEALDHCTDPDVRTVLGAEIERADGDTLIEWIGRKLRARAMDAEAALLEIVVFFRREPDTTRLTELAERHGLVDCAAKLHLDQGVRCSKARATADALRHLSRAAELYRASAAASDADLEQLVSSLNAMGITYYDVSEFTAAETAYREALTYARDLATRTDARSLLAMVLNNLGNCLCEEAKLNDAEAALREALELRRSLTSASPSAEAVVASTLFNLGPVLRLQRHFDAALGTLNEALEIRSRLAAAHPERFRLDKARTLGSIASVLSDMRASGDAYRTLEQALGVLEGIASDAPPPNRLGIDIGFAGFLGRPSPLAVEIEIAAVRAKLGRIDRSREHWDDALRHLRAAEQAYRKATSGGRTHADALSKVLQDVAAVLWETGDDVGAHDAMQEALAAAETLHASDPAYGVQFADSLNECGLLFVKQQEFDEAASCFRRAVAELEAVRARDPQAHTSELALTLANLALVLALKKDAAWREVSAAAIRTAEGAEEAESTQWLSKGRVGCCYSLQAWDAVTRADRQRVFRCLAALRNPAMRLFGEDDDALAAALDALRHLEAFVGRRIRIVLAHRMPDGLEGSLLGILQSEDPALRVVHDGEFQGHALMLWHEVASAFAPEETRTLDVQRQQLARRAHAAWLSLPAFLRDALSVQGGDLLISGDPFWSAFPWDALQTDESNDPGIGATRALPRWLDVTAGGLATLGPRTLGPAARTAAVVCPWDAVEGKRLSGAQREARSVAEVLARLGYLLRPNGAPLMGREATANSLLALLDQELTILHYSGHGYLDGNDAGLVLWNSPGTGPQTISRQELGESRTRGGAGGLLVMNACHVGRARSFGGHGEDLPAAFLARGAAVTVASPLPVSDAMGATFAHFLYRSGAVPEDGILGAFSRARTAAREAAIKKQSRYWKSWPLFILTGNPYARLPHASEAVEEGLWARCIAHLVSTFGFREGDLASLASVD